MDTSMSASAPPASVFGATTTPPSSCRSSSFVPPPPPPPCPPPPPPPPPLGYQLPSAAEIAEWLTLVFTTPPPLLTSDRHLLIPLTTILPSLTNLRSLGPSPRLQFAFLHDIANGASSLRSRSGAPNPDTVDPDASDPEDDLATREAKQRRRIQKSLARAVASVTLKPAESVLDERGLVLTPRRRSLARKRDTPVENLFAAMRKRIRPRLPVFKPSGGDTFLSAAQDSAAIPLRSNVYRSPRNMVSKRQTREEVEGGQQSFDARTARSKLLRMSLSPHHRVAEETASIEEPVARRLFSHPTPPRPSTVEEGWKAELLNRRGSLRSATRSTSDNLVPATPLNGRSSITTGIPNRGHTVSPRSAALDRKKSEYATSKVDWKGECSPRRPRVSVPMHAGSVHPTAGCTAAEQTSHRASYAIMGEGSPLGGTARQVGRVEAVPCDTFGPVQLVNQITARPTRFPNPLPPSSPLARSSASKTSDTDISYMDSSLAPTPSRSSPSTSKLMPKTRLNRTPLPKPTRDDPVSRPRQSTPRPHTPSPPRSLNGAWQRTVRTVRGLPNPVEDKGSVSSGRGTYPRRVDTPRRERPRWR